MKNLTLIILASLSIFSCKENNPTEIDSLEMEKTTILEFKIDSLTTINDSLIQALSVEKPESDYGYDALYDGKDLLRNGIADPAGFIESSLQKKPELIPLNGILGGTMHFVKIQPLSSQWIIAYYEDGHIEGRALYKYHLNKNGELEFELLDSLEPE